MEEAAGELHRRIAMALRSIGERRADRTVGDARSPRWEVASLVTATELAVITLGAIAAGTETPLPRLERQPASVAAVMYAAPTIQSLLSRLEQDRRLLASIARFHESHLDEEHDTPWGRTSLRQLVSNVAIVQSARCAVTLERVVGEADT